MDYSDKGNKYFAGARKDWIDQLLPNPTGVILEVGCASGNTGFLALSQGKCGRYCGIELMHEPAASARQKISEVLVGNVETLELNWPDSHFDVLIMSEVLEHLVDPWTVLKRIRPLLKSGAVVFASSPNVSHHQIVRMILSNRWDLANEGVMDRTHLRWFTPYSYAKMFEDCGYIVDRVAPIVPLSRKAKLICKLMGGWGEHLFAYQIDLKAHRS